MLLIAILPVAWAPISSATTCRLARFLAHNVTSAPANAIIFAVAAPIPLLAPNISACLPRSAFLANGKSLSSKSMMRPIGHMTYYYAIKASLVLHSILLASHH